MMDGRPVQVRRVDGDANGLLADPQDRVWIDLDGDGQWQPVGEQFLFTPILKLNNQRYALRGDSRGERLELVPLMGVGAVSLKLPQSLSDKNVQEIQVT